jgi:molybdopterin molybdotransferase
LINVRKWALLAHCGITNALVFKRPKVAVFTTGNEVITPYDIYKEGKVYNTNSYILKGLVEKWGGEFHHVPHLRDDTENIKEALDKAFLSFDVIVTTGGVSRGKTDFTKKAIEECGVNIVFSKPNVKPGRPFTFGIKNKTLLFAFSGPPAAMFMTAYAFLKPALLKMSGREDYMEKLFDCELLEDMHSKKGKLYLNRVKFVDEETKASVGSSGSQKSDNFLSVVNADGFIMIDENKDDVGKFSVFKGGRFDD